MLVSTGTARDAGVGLLMPAMSVLDQGGASVQAVSEEARRPKFMATLVVGLLGALGGGLISMLTSALTLRSSHRAEQARWVADRRWEFASGLVNARRDTYARFLTQQNAVIMTVGSTMKKVQDDKKILRQMPTDQAAAYQGLQDAWAQSLLLANPSLRALLEEDQNYLSQRVWASWRGEDFEGRPGLYGDLLAAMQAEVVEQPQL